MAATDRARQIAALADKLQPLAGKSRGMRIEADEWNALVDVLSSVLQIDHSQDEDAGALLDGQFARIDHQHLGQVSASWLDADLQARTGDGGGGSVATRQVLSDMQAKLAALQTQVGQLTSLLQTQQSTTDRASANDLDRTRQIQSFDTRFAGVEDLRTLVSGVSQSQQSLQTNVGAVLELSKSLSDATGRPIDVAGLSQQVASLQTLRDSLTGIDGKPLRLRDLQLQLSALSDSIPASAGGTLDNRLSTLSNDVLAKADTAAQVRVDALRTDMTDANTQLASGLSTKLETDIAAGRDAAIQSATAQVTASEGRTQANLTAGIAAAQVSLSASLQASIGPSVSQSLEGLDARIATVVDGRLPGLRAQLRADLTPGLADNVTTSVNSATAAFDTRVTAVETGLAGVGTSLPAQIDAAVASRANTLQQTLAGQVTAQTAQLQTQLGATLDSRANAAAAAAVGDVKATAAQAAADSLKDLDARIASSVTAATATIPAQVTSSVNSQLAQANLDGRIQTATTSLATQLRSEIAASAAKVQANSTTALNSAVINLRGELSTRTQVTTRVVPVANTPLRPG